MGSKGDFSSLTHIGKHRDPEVSVDAEQEAGQKPHFTDFQLNPFPVGYPALNELSDKGISKI